MSVVLHISLEELCEQQGINEADIVQMVEHKIVLPQSASSDNSSWVFHSRDVSWMQKAVRLQRDLDIDWLAISIIVDLLKNNDELVQQNRLLQQRLQRFVSDSE